MKHSSIHISFAGIISTAIFIFIFSIANAQNNLNITFRPGANFPVNDLGETKLNNGGGFETVVSYKFTKYFQTYAGWGWNLFSEKESINDSKLEFNETGYSFGLQFIHPLSSKSKLNYLIGAGGVYNHIETENKDGDILNETEHGLGYQVEAGLTIPIGHHDRWQLIPEFRYHSLSSDITSQGLNTKAELNYFSVGLGVCWILWKAK